ncbi:MAG: hypothetical protein ABFE02_17015 [Sulfuricella sp.]
MAQPNYQYEKRQKELAKKKKKEEKLREKALKNETGASDDATQSPESPTDDAGQQG